MPQPPLHDESSKPVPEMVAATSAPFDLGPGVTEVTLSLHEPAGPARQARGARPPLVTLRIENITGEQQAPPFQVYLEVPPGDIPEHHPERMAGSLGLFGLVESSRSDDRHGGGGLGFSLDVSRLFHECFAGREWETRQLRVQFAPSFWDTPVPRVRVGRVSLYFS